MQDGLIYVNTNNVIYCVLYRLAVLRITQGGRFMYFVLKSDLQIPTE